MSDMSQRGDEPNEQYRWAPPIIVPQQDINDRSHTRPQHGQPSVVPAALNTPTEDNVKTDRKGTRSRNEGRTPGRLEHLRAQWTRIFLEL
ncbi:hypothetical protein BHM03_00038588 [Ensete ventricosum]|nr:hypothetical protein BHM03_00038588 [Ensete ventricosum]